MPVDSAAPKGRLILPQQQVIRDILEAEAVSVVVKENGLKNILDQLKENPRMVITDSQVFKKVSKDTPADVPLTSFSILMARYKGNLEQAVRGVTELDRLKDGDVAVSYTHLDVYKRQENGLAEHISFTSICNSFASLNAKSNRILESF